jgi:hypothetical protein
MKRIITTTLAALALLVSLPAARAWTYSDGDVLLVFRASGFNDVEFDLGNVNQFTNLASGTTVTVSGWSLNLVTNTFGADLTGVSVILAGTTPTIGQYDPSEASWLSSGDPTAVAYQLTQSQWQSKLWSTINSIGTRPVIYQVPASGANGYKIDPGSSYKLASYDNIVTANGQNSASLAQLGGNSAFTVEGVTPASFGFWQISPNSTVPKPAAIYLGTFHITAAGVLTYTAGAPAPSATTVSRAAGVNTVTFTTAVGGNYWLTYTNDVKSPPASWPVVAGPLTGDGNVNSLNHTTADNVGFYRVKRTP